MLSNSLGGTDAYLCISSLMQLWVIWETFNYKEKGIILGKPFIKGSSLEAPNQIKA